MKTREQISTLVLIILASTFTTTTLFSAPSDSAIVLSDARVNASNQLGFRLERPISAGPSFNPLDGKTLVSSSQLDRSSDPRMSQESGAQIDNSGESSSFLKPALFIGGALATTGILIRTDQMSYDVLRRWRMKVDPIEDTSPAITNLGDGRASMVIFGGLLTYSFIHKDNQAFQAGKVGLESFLVTGIVTQILKHTFGRERPSTATRTGGRWNGAYLLLNQGSGKRGGYAQYDAFPSGHTATIFAAATTLAEVYHNSPWVSYASYGIATSVAISRVMERDHWLSDCFVGGLIGYFGTQLVLHYNHTDKPIVLLPTYDGTQMGLALSVGL